MFHSGFRVLLRVEIKTFVKVLDKEFVQGQIKSFAQGLDNSFAQGLDKEIIGFAQILDKDNDWDNYIRICKELK